MHRFLPAIGFYHPLCKQDVDQLLGYIMNEPDLRKETSLGKTMGNYVEISKDLGHNIGITIRGQYDKLGFFHIEHYFPYCKCGVYTATEDIVVNKRVDTDAYTAMCDDIRLGVSMIFYLQNAVDYLAIHAADNTPRKAKLSLSGLSLQGTILLGVAHTDEFIKKKNYEKSIRKQLMMQAKEGDQDAIDSLMVDDMDLNERIMQRSKREDLYSIVDTSFIPYGSESDNYLVIGTIVTWTVVTNQYTHEDVYHLLLNCNDIVIAVSINCKDLSGSPGIGCRFKGVIWMQGFVDFQSMKE